jgi:hypothetical protein
MSEHIPMTTIGSYEISYNSVLYRPNTPAVTSLGPKIGIEWILVLYPDKSICMMNS